MNPLLSAFLRISAVVAIAIVALIIAAFVLKIAIVAAVIAAIVLGGILIYKRIRGRGGVPVIR
ncbi:MAG: hypothetical protein M3N13_04300 [Candidatus Eremiobacteraeota bacterium]|nr:hypothetical protein [Candidatus Eremiobacteraeota bacterium]